MRWGSIASFGGSKFAFRMGVRCAVLGSPTRGPGPQVGLLPVMGKSGLLCGRPPAGGSEKRGARRGVACRSNRGWPGLRCWPALAPRQSVQERIRACAPSPAGISSTPPVQSDASGLWQAHRAKAKMLCIRSGSRRARHPRRRGGIQISRCRASSRRDSCSKRLRCPQSLPREASLHLLSALGTRGRRFT